MLNYETGMADFSGIVFACFRWYNYTYKSPRHKFLLKRAFEWNNYWRLH